MVSTLNCEFIIHSANHLQSEQAKSTVADITINKFGTKLEAPRVVCPFSLRQEQRPAHLPSQGGSPPQMPFYDALMALTLQPSQGHIDPGIRLTYGIRRPPFDGDLDVDGGAANPQKRCRLLEQIQLDSMIQAILPPELLDFWCGLLEQVAILEGQNPREGHTPSVVEVLRRVFLLQPTPQQPAALCCDHQNNWSKYSNRIIAIWSVVGAVSQSHAHTIHRHYLTGSSG